MSCPVSESIRPPRQHESLRHVAGLAPWQGVYVDSLNEECYLNDDVLVHSFESKCRSTYFVKTWSWTDPDFTCVALDPLRLAFLSNGLTTAHQQRDLVRLNRVGYDATMTNERSHWAFSTIRGA